MALDSLNHITIDVSDPLTTPVVRAVQEDIRSRYVEITLVRNGTPLDIPAGAYGMIGMRRADGTFCLYDYTEDETPAVTISGNVVTIYLSQAALSVAGPLYTSVSLYSPDGQTKLTAFAFTVAVEAVAVPSGAVPSTYINILEGLIADAVDAANRAEQAAAQVGDPVSYTAQTKTDAQKAQARTNIGAMALDTHPTPAEHASTHALGGSDALSPADIGTIRVYKSVTELGLTDGSATIAGAFSAMANNSLGWFEASQFTSGQTPNTFGFVEIHKRSGSRASVHFWGEETSRADYRMYLNSSNVPDGTWMRICGETTANFARNYSYITAENNAIKFRRVGSVVTMYGSIYPTYNVPAHTSVGTIPDGFRPADNISLLFIPSAQQPATPYWVYAGTNGVCSMQNVALPANVSYYVTATYIAK